MPYVSPKDLSIVPSITSPRSSHNASPAPPPPVMTEPVDSLATALAQSSLNECAEGAGEFDSPPALSECATTSSNSVQTVSSDSRGDGEEPEVISPSRPPQDNAPVPTDTDSKAAASERTDLEPAPVSDDEVTVVQDPPPSGTVLDAIPALPDLDLCKLQTYSRAIYDFTLKLYVRAQKDSLAKGHTLPGEFCSEFGKLGSVWASANRPPRLLGPCLVSSWQVCLGDAKPPRTLRDERVDACADEATRVQPRLAGRVVLNLHPETGRG